jgi:small-conductance mechanosensitive channel/CRP-like cAMP-binding protein
VTHFAPQLLPLTALAAFSDHFRTAAAMGVALPWITAAFLVATIAILAWVPAQRKRAGAAILLFLGGFAFLLVSTALLSGSYTAQSGAYRTTRFIGLLLVAAALINVTAVLLFDVLLRGVLRLRPPAIVLDLIVAVAWIVVAISLLGAVGVNLTGIVATSAIVTAVIAFSLQDTLGNIMGGVAVQMDRSLHIGDWIRVGDIEGRVTQIRWRHTGIETRAWDTVLIPNTQLSKSNVTVLGRRTDEPVQRRQAVPFNVDYRYSPTQVMDVVESALRGETLSGVASRPQPNCIMMDFKDSYATYAARYWLTDMNTADVTDSLIRSRVYAALRRAGIDPSIPAQHVFLTRDEASRKGRKEAEEMQRRVQVLAGVDVFEALTDEERREIAGRLRVAPFLRGEAIMVQGTRGDWLYVLQRGTAEVRVSSDDGRASTTLATLGPGDFFGEMALMLDGQRSATVVALTDCACYRLDKHDFMEIIARRPGIAEEIAATLAKRRTELEAAKEGLNEQAKRERQKTTEDDLLARIRRFFDAGT